MSANGIGALERGYRRTPQHETLALLSSALALDPQQHRELEDAARPGGAGVAGDSWLDDSPGNLPLPLSSFIGRDAEIREIASELHECRLLTLTGAAGIGKTQTALRAATAFGEATGTAAIFVDLSTIDDPTLVTAVVATSLGIREAPDRTLLETIRGFLKAKKALLVFDNCEHVIDEAAKIARAILSDCPSIRILATSREPLRDAGERSYRLPSLPVPHAGAGNLTATDGLAYSSIALFADRARAANHRFVLRDENVNTVAQICRSLDGIPLAIELAAPWSESLTLDAIVENLGGRLQLLGRGHRSALSRDQTMRATIDWSYELLSLPEQRLLERLSVFAGGCTLELAETVCSNGGVEEAGVLALLASLADKSLVTVERPAHGETRYVLLETTRQFARERLRERGEEQRIAQRHAEACLDVAERLERLRVEVNKPNNRDGLPEFFALRARERANLRAAIAWSLDDGRNAELGQRLVCSVWGMQGVWETQLTEPLRWTRRALELAGPGTPLTIVARLERVLCLYLEQGHRFDEALAAVEHRAETLGKIGETTGMGNALTMAYLRCGRLAEARTVAERLVALLREREDPRALGAALLGLAGALSAQEIYPESHAALREARSLLQIAGDGYLLGICDSQLATSFFGLNDMHAALPYAESATATLRAWQHAFLPEALSNEATFLVALDRFDDAYERAMESLDVALRNFPHAPVRALYGIQRLATIAALRPYGNADDARKAWTASATLLGYADALLNARAAFRFPTDQVDIDRAGKALRSHLGDEGVDELFREGASLSDERAIALARSTF